MVERLRSRAARTELGARAARGGRRGNEPGLRTIRASEIGDYSYCSRAWWYRHVAKVEAPDSAAQSGRFGRGIEAHRRHGRGVSAAGKLRTLAIIVALLAVFLLVLVFVTALGPGR